MNKPASLFKNNSNNHQTNHQEISVVMFLSHKHNKQKIKTMYLPMDKVINIKQSQ